MDSFRGYSVTPQRIELPGGALEIISPADCESLVDAPQVAQRFEQDEYLPYWAEVWPASLLLAERVANWSDVNSTADAGRPQVLELGCGLGLVAIAAARLGYRVIASDYDGDALAFVIENARRNDAPPPEVRFVDWRERYSDLRLERIVAADVTYESRSLAPLARFVLEHLAPGGEALIVDSNRSIADPFPEIAREIGLDVRVELLERDALDPGAAPLEARMFVLQRAERT